MKTRLNIFTIIYTIIYTYNIIIRIFILNPSAGIGRQDELKLRWLMS